MNSLRNFVQNASDNHSAFGNPLARADLHAITPAAFAHLPDESTSERYSFLSTERALDAFAQAGFLPVDAAQSRGAFHKQLVARHAIRLRRRYETVQLRDTIPEIVFINGHDGKTALQLRLGLFRAVCTNGLIVSTGVFSFWRLPHRGDLLGEVVSAALQQSELFSELGRFVERMERTPLELHQRVRFAEAALALRFPDDHHGGMQPSQLLAPRRPEDVGDDLWRTYNVIQLWGAPHNSTYVERAFT